MAAFRSDKNIADFVRALPAPNPLFAQWWFTVETVGTVVDRLRQEAHGPAVLVLGAPSVAFGLAADGFAVTTFDADEHSVALLRQSELPIDARVLELSRRRVDTAVGGPFNAVFMDPPWYPGWFRVFLEQVQSVIAPAGLLCSSLMTAEYDRESGHRSAIRQAIRSAGFTADWVRHGGLTYTVPAQVAAVGAGADTRSGDLLLARAPLSGGDWDAFAQLGDRPAPQPEVRVYARAPSQFRVFARQPTANHAAWQDSSVMRPVPFASGHSSREIPDVWTSDRRGVRLRDRDVHAAVAACLERWSEGRMSKEPVVMSPGIQDVFERLDANLGLSGCHSI